MVETLAIETTSLRKYYGPVCGIEDVNLRVCRGEIFGYLGPNGAGKTTTIRLLLDLIRPSGGSTRVLGQDPQREGVRLRSRVGYLPGELRLYAGQRGGQLLDMAARMHGGVDQAYRRRLLERLPVPLERPVRTYSHGMRQKLGLLLALQHRPELLILDEPSNGLDPLVQQELYAILRQLQGQGLTVFFSSHVLSEVERVCERVAVIRQGRLVAVEEIPQLRQKSAPTITIRFSQPVPDDAFRLPGVGSVSAHNATLTLTQVRNVDGVIKAASRFQVEELYAQPPTLEEVFLTYYTEAPEGAEA